LVLDDEFAATIFKVLLLMFIMFCKNVSNHLPNHMALHLRRQ
jgi:hypothetical protein